MDDEQDIARQQEISRRDAMKGSLGAAAFAAFATRAAAPVALSAAPLIAGSTQAQAATADLKRYSLGTKNKNLKRNSDGSLTLYAGGKSPGKDKETNWLPAPDGKFSLYIRAYWGKEGILDGSWRPPKIEPVKT